jgi:hypothetical protein
MVATTGGWQFRELFVVTNRFPPMKLRDPRELRPHLAPILTKLIRNAPEVA